ncbi:MAG: prepilin peptidase [Lachnospiraceae bacterium]|nr:prepilin peptidase [Lachnospiraceae bacterium]
MKQLKYCGALIFLGILSWEDIKKKEISVKVVLIGAAAALVCQLISGQAAGMRMISSLLPGIGLILLSIVTKESIGKGDGVVVMALGLWLGGLMTFLTVCLALCTAGIFALIYLLQKRQELIPFVPCLLIGMEVLFWYG